MSRAQEPPAGAPMEIARDTAAILRERARRLAQPESLQRGVEAAAGAAREMLEFRLADERYAVDSAFVREVHPLKNLTSLPCTPAFVAGIMNLRGRIVAVIDLKRFLGLPERGLTDLHRIVLVGDDTIEFGLLADVSVGMLRVEPAELQPPLPTLTEIGARYIQGITADRLVVLDMPAILGDPRLLVDEEPQEG